jgi:hypothetical protein
MHSSVIPPAVDRGEPSARRLARRFGPLRASLGCAVAIAALSLLARETGQDKALPAASRPIRPAVLVAPAPVWQAIPGAKANYALDLAELASLPQTHEARRHAGGGREDKLVFGVFESDRPYLRLALFRGPQDSEHPASFFLDLARRAGEAGLAVVRSGRTGLVATKLGPLEAAEVVLSDSVERACLAFRLRPGEIGFSAQGWSCAGGGPEISFDARCLIDSLALLPTAEDPALRVLFAQAERKRSPGCGAPAETKPRTG